MGKWTKLTSGVTWPRVAAPGGGERVRRGRCERPFAVATLDSFGRLLGPGQSSSPLVRGRRCRHERRRRARGWLTPRLPRVFFAASKVSARCVGAPSAPARMEYSPTWIHVSRFGSRCSRLCSLKRVGRCSGSITRTFPACTGGGVAGVGQVAAVAEVVGLGRRGEAGAQAAGSLAVLQRCSVSAPLSLPGRAPLWTHAPPPPLVSDA